MACGSLCFKYLLKSLVVFVFLTCPRKKFRLFFEKGYLHKNKTNCGKNDIFRFYDIKPLQRARYVLIRGGVRGEGGSQLSFNFTMRYETFVSCSLVFGFSKRQCYILFIFYSTLFSESSVPSQREISVLIFINFTAAAFNSVYFSVQTRFD